MRLDHCMIAGRCGVGARDEVGLGYSAAWICVRASWEEAA